MPGNLGEVYDRLFEHFGPQGWWPADSAWEVMVGAILVQNTSWKNVERAIEQLQDAGQLSLRALNRLDQTELEELIRPAGYFRLKARRLRNLIDFVVSHYDGSVESIFDADLQTLRQQLLGVNGIGPETADSILLYAGSFPTFVVDTYTHRVLSRHGWIGFDADYHAIKDHFESNLEEEVPLYNEFHALLVRLGHEFCRKTARCEQCPLQTLLPNGKPLTPH